MVDLVVIGLGLLLSANLGAGRSEARERRRRAESRPRWLPDLDDGAAIAAWLRTDPPEDRVIILEHELRALGDHEAAAVVQERRQARRTAQEGNNDAR
jgi:hypothetical protein